MKGGAQTNDGTTATPQRPLVVMADVRQYKFVRLLGKGGFAEVFEYVSILDVISVVASVCRLDGGKSAETAVVCRPTRPLAKQLPSNKSLRAIGG